MTQYLDSEVIFCLLKGAVNGFYVALKTHAFSVILGDRCYV